MGRGWKGQTSRGSRFSFGGSRRPVTELAFFPSNPLAAEEKVRKRREVVSGSDRCDATA